MRVPKNDVQEVKVTIAAAATTGTTEDPCNPLRGSLKKVEMYAANDANVSGVKLELLRYDQRSRAYVAVYTSDNEAIVDDGTWRSADSDKDLDVALSTAKDGNYTWRATADAATAASFDVYIRRTLEV